MRNHELLYGIAACLTVVYKNLVYSIDKLTLCCYNDVVSIYIL
jgi:hypothetical protein